MMITRPPGKWGNEWRGIRSELEAMEMSLKNQEQKDSRLHLHRRGRMEDAVRPSID